MAFSNQNPLTYVFLVISKPFFFLMLLLNNVESSKSICFTFNSFRSEVSDLILQGDAMSTSGTIQLTKTAEDGSPLTSRAGRALFSAPVHLWDSSTGKVASFSTSFSFLLKTTANNPADGLTFFIVPPDSQIKKYGGYLGLFNPDTATDPSKNQVVAVEFDTWHNYEWKEPTYRHIGINVNSIESVATVKWEDSDVFSGSIATARITYDAVSQTLSVHLRYPNGGSYSLSHVIDFTTVNLPEWVRVGFSGSTGNYETEYVHSWYFSSTLQSSRDNAKYNITKSAI